ncbi:ATP-dependent RNA helicase HrpA [Corynebacterium pseudokroppenstedtii]|uniref:ATP-dependent RNA helicase HrpA n=1 Tax=Corynebacterium pseudokroppenstedtii TaxID=2804917 RepID=UPI001F01126E|nr:ATP-dependent RNA helicase HrpA [Corynebacterium pseudokroppenstedtii]MCF6794358.1 ATP-dependent RNA helicase HrpA [Corynebacterium pseudokroppenstedtii]
MTNKSNRHTTDARTTTTSTPDTIPSAPSRKELYAQLSEISAADEHRFRRRLKKARSDRARHAIARDLAVARTQFAAKIATLPTITYPPDLPVTQRVDDIAETIRTHQVTIVAGETGSGKTTQIPKICLALGRGRKGMIGHTQPRRLAARTVAERIASEVGQDIGQSVGYAIRFDDRVGPSTAIKLMTDGILLAEMQRDRLLRAYDTIIIDEAHERSLNIDFILGYIKRLLPRRPDLKVIITSATIDPEKFARHFADAEGNPAPIIEVSGRTYPVEIRYRPSYIERERKDGSVKRIEKDPQEAVCEACEELMAAGPGDILCFFPSERDIREAQDAIEAKKWRGVEVTPLFGRLSNAEQHRVFSPHRGRRIVLATNIAETSLTVPGIHYVVDTGTARISRYSTRTKVQRLPIEPISQASANQRSGRSGRIAKGIAIRLYSEEDFESRPEFTDPEVLRTNLASVIITMASLKLGDINEFPFIDPPEPRAIRDGMMVLHELGALGEGERDGSPVLSSIGREISRIPVDPRLARMLVEAHHRDVVEATSVVIAALSIQDVRERPTDHEPQADQAHARFKDTESDFVSYLRLWAYLTSIKNELSGNAFRKRCRAEYLHYMRVREWMDFVRQLRRVTEDLSWSWDQNRLTPVIPNDDESTTTSTKKRSRPNKKTKSQNDNARPDMPMLTVDHDGLHRSILSGILSQIGLRSEVKKEYQGTRGTRFFIFPGSSLHKKQPQWLMAAEIVETSRMFARDAAAIQPRWIEEQASDLLRHQYSEPHWSRKRSAAMAYQRSTLWGLPVVTDRPISYHRINPRDAREIFIRSALVEGDWVTRHKFFHHNRDKLATAGELEEKTRRRDLLIDDDTLYDFYDSRIPASVTTGRHFDAWWKKQSKKDPHLLDFDPDKLLHPEAHTISEDDFPDRWRAHSTDLELTYKFEPGEGDDGVSVRIPLPIIGSLSWDDRFDWNVPGLRRELVTALIRSLPKPLRTTVVPAPDFARRAIEMMDPYAQPLTDSLADALRAVGGSGMTAADFDVAKLPLHLRMNFQAVDRHGKVIDQDRDLDALKKRQSSAATQAMSAAFKRSKVGSTLSRDHSDYDGSAHDLPGTQADSRSNTARPSDEDATAVPDLGKVYAEWTDKGIGTLPESVQTTIDGQPTTAYPALKVTSKGIEVVTSASQSTANSMMFTAVLTLLVQSIKINENQAVKGLPLQQRVAVEHYPHGGLSGLVNDCRVAAIKDALVDHGVIERSPEAFEALKKEMSHAIPAATRRMVIAMAPGLVAYESMAEEIKKWDGPAIDDIKRQLNILLPPNAVTWYGTGHLKHLQRYMKAVEIRLENMERDPDRDADGQEEINNLERAFRSKLNGLPQQRAKSSAARAIIFSLQELRVQVFAERLGTAQKVSPQRITKAINKLR